VKTLAEQLLKDRVSSEDMSQTVKENDQKNAADVMNYVLGLRNIVRGEYNVVNGSINAVFGLGNTV
jgi:hypothetical protein